MQNLWHKKFDKFWPVHWKVSKIFTLMGSFWPKFFQTFHETEQWCKIWRKANLWYGKCHGEFDKISPENSKSVSKLGYWCDPFIQSRKGVRLEITEELCDMTMKNYAKFEEELNCRFKTDKRNLANFDTSTQKSQRFEL